MSDAQAAADPETSLARTALRITALLVIAGSALAVFVAGPAGLLSPYQHYSAMALGLLAAGSLALEVARPDTYRRNAVLLSAASWLYLVSNVVVSVLDGSDPDVTLVYMMWSVTLYVFLFVVLRRSLALVMSLAGAGIMTAAAALQAVSLETAGHSASVDVRATWILAQFASIALIFGVVRMLEARVAEQATVQMRLESAARERDLLRDAQRHEQRLRRLIATAQDLIAEITPEGVIVDVSPSCKAVCGYDRAEMVGRHFSAFFAPEDLEAVRGAFAQVLAREPVSTTEHRVRARSGELVPLLWSASYAAEDRVVFVIGKDLRERLQRERRAAHSAKLEALGQLTGGIAHDFNNILTAMTGATELLELQLPAEAPARRHTDLLRSAVSSATRLTDRLLRFARRDPLQLSVHDVRGMVDGAAALLERSLGRRIELVLEQTGTALPAQVDAAELETAIVNLAVNSRDAMPDGGRVVLATRQAALARELALRFGTLPAGDYAVIEVVDDGIGIPPDQLDRITEPYFTTKGQKGTGLGLSLVRSLVERLSGGLDIESEPGRGTTVRLYLPLAAMPPNVVPLHGCKASSR
jgi:PAS domain S-box-containing protein